MLRSRLRALIARNTLENAMMDLKTHVTCEHKCDQNVCELWFAECGLFHFKS